MNQQTQSTQETHAAHMQQNPAPPAPPGNTPPPPQGQIQKNPSPLLYILIIMVLAVIGWFFFQNILKNQSEPIAEEQIPTPLPTRRVTPIQELSQHATTSAFIDLETSVASLSSQISTTTLKDNRLTPPNIDIEVGFSK